MDPRFTSAAWGWRRFLLHFGGAWGVSSAVLYALFAAGVPHSTRWLAAGFFAACVVLLIIERRETRAGQSSGKAAVDLLAKCAGLAVSVFTSGLWWV
jgi:preprotein translocase subunit SecG